MAFVTFPVSSITFSTSSVSETAETHKEKVASLKTLASSKHAVRGFCEQCGSPLTMSYHVDSDTLHLTLGSVDFPDNMLDGVQMKHIYLQDKPEWYHLPDDGIPRYETMPNMERYLGTKN